MASHAAEYKRLDAVGEELTRRERKIGWFESGSILERLMAAGDQRTEPETGEHNGNPQNQAGLKNQNSPRRTEVWRRATFG